MVLLGTASKEREGTGCVDRRSKQSAEQIQQEWSGKETHSHLHSKGIEVSHRISKERARQLSAKDQELRQMQKEGKTLPKSRRQKKYELARKKQDGFLWRLKDRIIKNKGKMPKHLKEEQ